MATNLNDREIQEAILRRISELEGRFTGMQTSQNVHSQHRPDIMLATVEAWRRENIYVTKSVQAVKDKALIKDCVCVIGVPGAGKSTAIHHAALSLETVGFIIYFISDPTEFLKYYDERKKQVFVVDDAMGVYLTSSSKVGLWQEHNDRVKNALGANTKLLVSVRTQIFKSEINRDKIVFLDKPTADHVDFSDDGYRIGLDDMRGMLKHYMTNKGITVENINQVINNVWPKNETELTDMTKEERQYEMSRYTVGQEFAECFPLLCKVFINTDFVMLNPEAFFKNPYQALTKIFQNIKLENKHQFCALVLCTMFDGKLASDMISPFSESPLCETKREIGKDKIELRNHIMSIYKLKCPRDLEDLQLAFKSLTGVYISLENDKYKMSHAVFSDIVVYLLDDPLLVFKTGTSEFIRDRVRISATSSDDPYVLRYSDDINVVRLGRRLIKDLRNDPERGAKLIVDNQNIDDDRLIEYLHSRLSDVSLEGRLIYVLFRASIRAVWHHKNEWRQYKLIESCVHLGADCNLFIGDEDEISGLYPIHISICVDSLRLTKLLLENGADKRRVDTLGLSVLFWACTYTKCNKLEFMKLLTQHGDDQSVVQVTRGEDDIRRIVKKYSHGMQLVRPSFSLYYRDVKVLATDKNSILNYLDNHNGLYTQLVRQVHDNILTYLDIDSRNVLHHSVQDLKVTSYLLSLAGIKHAINQRDFLGHTPYWFLVNKKHPEWKTAEISDQDHKDMIKLYEDNHAIL